MSDAEAVRYDRQVRLWGKSTQQQLMHTNVVFDGISGVAAEAAKNLVLAGVRGVAVVDAATVSAADAKENYIMQGEAGATRAARAIRALRRLNPYVRVCASPAELGQGSAVVRVVTIASLDEGSACIAEASANSVDLLVLHTTLHNTVAAFVLYRKLATSCSLEEQWRRLVANPALLSEKPAAFQRVVLALHQRSGATAALTFAEAAAAAYERIDALQLQQLRADDVEAALSVAATAADAICATLAGACIAQHLIRQIGSLRDEAQSDAPSHRWLLCSVAGEVECMVGM